VESLLLAAITELNAGGEGMARPSPTRWGLISDHQPAGTTKTELNSCDLRRRGEHLPEVW